MTSYSEKKINDFIDVLAGKLRPELAQARGQRRIGEAADVFTLLYSIPIALLGLFWLAGLTDIQALLDNWYLLVLFAALIFIFDRLNYFLITEIRSGGYANTEGDLDTIVLWSAVFVLGPGALWLIVILATVYFLNQYRRAGSSSNRWQLWRVYVSGLSVNVISSLVALWVFQLLGGVIPLTNISVDTILPAMLAFLVQFVMAVVLVSGYFLYVAWGLKAYLGAPTLPFANFFFLAFALPALANPFSVLAAGLYAIYGLPIYLFFMTGLLLVALLARRLSMAAEFSRQQTRQLEEMEKLGRALLIAPPDGSTLEEILVQNVPAMFTAEGILIQLESGRVLLSHPEDWSPDWDDAWKWLCAQKKAQAFVTRDQLPWRSNDEPHSAMVLAPIMDAKNDQVLGGIYIQLRSLSLPWDIKTIANLIPAVQSLSDQIASALHQAKVYRGTLELQRTVQEIALARRIQASFLPEALPEFPGWQIAATLEPARQIAGDFYDFIPLSNNLLGILIADVADKGLGPALYMALSRTLIRTFAAQYLTQPAEVLGAANRRIIQDARANLFVTVFYGVLDLKRGELIYGNAGHTPPYLLHSSNEGIYTTLKNTGMPLGIDEGTSWGQDIVTISPGDVLLLYTDGVTDAQNEKGEFIDRRAILNIARKNSEQTVSGLQAAILQEIHSFVGEAPRFDDITLVIVGREA